MKNGLLVYGDIGIDIHIRTSYQPKVGEDAKVENILFRPGGSAANCAAVAAQLGVKTSFIGFIGKDYYGKTIKRDLRNHGVCTKNLFSVEGDTGVTIAIREPLGERTFYSYRGVNSKGELSKIANSKFLNSKFLHMSGYSFQNQNSLNNALYLIEKAKQSKTLLSLDPSYWYSREFHQENPSLISEMDIVFPNREEARLLTGYSDPSKASNKLLEMGPRIVIIKLGAEGSYVASSNESHYLPAAKDTKVIDSTGAGDAFCGGFLFGQVIGLSIEESAIIGNFTSSNIISHIGGHSGAPTFVNLINKLKLTEHNELANKTEVLFNQLVIE